MNAITINSHELPIKEYSGQRVVTFKDIDAVHERPDGTARKRFSDNKSRFIEGVDYFKVKCSEVRPFFGQTPPNGFSPNADLVLITETGYLMLVKSFTDDLAWVVQRELVNGYFRAKEAAYCLNAQQLGNVVELAKLMTRLMERNKRRPADIVQTIGAQLERFDVPVPDSFYHSFSSSPENGKLTYKNSVSDFLAEFGDIEGKTTSEVYEAYQQYCRRTESTAINTSRGFGKEVARLTGVSTKPRHQNGETVRAYVK